MFMKKNKQIFFQNRVFKFLLRKKMLTGSYRFFTLEANIIPIYCCTLQEFKQFYSFFREKLTEFYLKRKRGIHSNLSRFYKHF